VAVAESDKRPSGANLTVQSPCHLEIPAKKYLASSSWVHLALFGFDPVYNEFIDVYLKELLHKPCLSVDTYTH